LKLKGGVFLKKNDRETHCNELKDFLKEKKEKSSGIIRWRNANFLYILPF
jgi:hypothetical protein